MSSCASKRANLFRRRSPGSFLRLPAVRSLAARRPPAIRARALPDVRGRQVSSRDALKPLTLLGIIDVRQGDGTYLRAGDSGLLPKAVEWGLLLGERRALDLVEARRHIEVALATLAAQRRGEQDLQDLRRLLRRIEERAQQSDDEFMERDMEFHLRLAEAARNSVLAGMLGEYTFPDTGLDHARHLCPAGVPSRRRIRDVSPSWRLWKQMTRLLPRQQWPPISIQPGRSSPGRLKENKRPLRKT